VIVSAAIVLAGGIGFLIAHHSEPATYGAFDGVPAYLRGIPSILHAAAALDWRAVIQLGLLLLIATPVARVAFALVAFALERDYDYVALTAGVLIILIYSLVSTR
jgi:uncharacterized membrane protein